MLEAAEGTGSILGTARGFALYGSSKPCRLQQQSMEQPKWRHTGPPTAVSPAKAQESSQANSSP